MQATTYNDEGQLTACDFVLLVPIDTPTPTNTPSEALMPANPPSEILSPPNSPLHDILVRPLNEQFEYGIHTPANNQVTGLATPADEHYLNDPTMSLEYEDQSIAVQTSSHDVPVDATALAGSGESMDLSMSPENQFVGISITAEEISMEKALLPSDAGCIECSQPPSSSTDYKSAGGYFRWAVDRHREYTAALASRDQAVKRPSLAVGEPVNPSTAKDEEPIGPLTLADAACSQEIPAYTLTEGQPDDLMSVDDQPIEAVPIPIHSPTMDLYPHLDELMVATARARAGEAHYPREVPREESYRYRFVRNVIAAVVRPQSRIVHGIDELMYNTAMERLEADILPGVERVYQDVPNYVHQVPRSGPLEADPWYVNQAPLNTEYVNQPPISPEYIDEPAPLIMINEYVDCDGTKRLGVDENTSDVRETDGLQETDGVVDVSNQKRLLETSEIESQRRRINDAIQLMIMFGKRKPEGEEPPPLGEETPQPLDVGVEDRQLQMFERPNPGIGLFANLELQEQYEVFQVSKVQEGALQVPEVQLCHTDRTQSYESCELRVHVTTPRTLGRQLQLDKAFQLARGNIDRSPGLEAEFGDLEVNRYELHEPQALRELHEVPEARKEEFQAPEADDEAAVPLTNPEVQRDGSEEFPDWDPELLISFGSEEPVLAQEEIFKIPKVWEERSQVSVLAEETLLVPGVDLEGEVLNESQEREQALEEMSEGLEVLDEGWKKILEVSEEIDEKLKEISDALDEELKEISEALDKKLKEISKVDEVLEEISEGPETLDEGLKPPTPDLQHDDSEAQKTYEGQNQEMHSTTHQIPQSQACNLETPRYESQRPHSQVSEAEKEEHPTSVIESEGQDVQRYENQEPHMPKEMSQALKTQEQMNPVLGARKEPQLPENNEWHPAVKKHCLQREDGITSPGPEVVQVWHNEIQRYESHDPQSSERSQTPETQEEHPSPFPGIPNWFPDRPRLSQEPLQVWYHQSQNSDNQQSQTSRETSRSRASQGLEQGLQSPEDELDGPGVQLRNETQLSRVVSPILKEQEQARQISEAREEESQSPRTRDRHRRSEGLVEGEASNISEEREEPETNIPGIQEWYTPIEAEHRMSGAQEAPETNIPRIVEWYRLIEAEARGRSEERKVSEAQEEVRRAAEALEEARQVLKAREEACWGSEAREESQLPGTQELHPESRREDNQELEVSRETSQTPEAQEGELPVFRMHGARGVSEPQESHS
ncbi:hypothetical protein P167DRAFT_577603 [Morchella conica CCBAS932]|uniref:Uncharacterized protein n=1 Tax=Morchella conica CCBAS932 TaxID=1392247 RepID=A0A3N4KEZ4_9PEZI|nr:hypothetical protein P167DRAFT_577603 [Morchella conica CCBAS932]